MPVHKLAVLLLAAMTLPYSLVRAAAPVSSIALEAALTAPLTGQDLYLEVSVNGVPSHLIAQFRIVGATMYSPESELRQLGFKIDPALIDEYGMVEFARVPSMQYQLDMVNQRIAITVAAEQLEDHRYDARQINQLRPTTSLGVALNYDIYAQHSALRNAEDISSVASLLNLRAFSPMGTFTQSGILRYADPPAPDSKVVVRLDSTFVSSNADALQTWRAGDLITDGNLSWTSAVRMGGIQLQRNFRLQPNLITFPLPQISGAAAVPSTVDVFINNMQRFSQPVQPGPYTIDNMPLITGQGEMRVVVTDLLGRQKVTTLPFYAAPNLLSPGLTDYTIEAGFLRRNYGQISNDYDSHVAGSGSIRVGVNDLLTLEGHTEATVGLLNAGVGGVVGLGNWGVLALSAAGSTDNGDKGGQAGLSYQFSSNRLGIFASTQRLVRNYQTLATHGEGFAITSTDQVSLSTPLGKGSISVGYVRAFDTGTVPVSAVAPATTAIASRGSEAATVFYSVSLLERLSLLCSYFQQLSPDRTYGVSVGISYFFGGHVSSSAEMEYRKGQGGNLTASVGQSLPVDGTGFGWDLRSRIGRDHQNQAGVGYRFPWITAEGGVIETYDAITSSLDLRGALVGMGGSLLFANPIFDGFALVDTVVPNVSVLRENNLVGRSNVNGKLLVTNLGSNVGNHITIDPRDLPPDVELGSDREVTAPSDRAGVLVKFAVTREDAATVSFQGTDGTPVPMGSMVTVNDAKESFIVGYDGIAYLKHLKADNKAVIALPSEGQCSARFAYQAQPGIAAVIGPLACVKPAASP